MALLVDLKKITSATAATPGTNAAGTNQPLDSLTGVTVYGAQPAELPSDCVSLNYYAQTSDATAVTVRMSPAASVIAGGNTWHRSRLRVRLVPQYADGIGSMPMQALSVTGAGSFTAGEWVQESSALKPRGKFQKIDGSNIMHLTECQGTFTGSGTLTGQTSAATATASTVRVPANDMIDINGNTAASNRCRVRFMLTNPSLSAPDLMRYAGSCISACIYLEDPSGGYAGSELTRNCTESGSVFLNAAGTGLSGGVYLPNFPIEEWGYLDFAFDKTAKRFYLAFNGWLLGVHSYANTTANTTTLWNITLPFIPGMRWHICEMQERDEATYATDTEVTIPVVSQEACRTWQIPPTWAALGVHPYSKLTIGATNATFLSRPMSLASGTRPFAEFGEWTSTSTSGVACSFGLAGNLPYVKGDDGWATFAMAIRPEGNSWTGFWGFGSDASLFQLDYSGGHYRIRTSAGAVVGTFDLNEQAIVLISIHEDANLCRATIYNNSKDITSVCSGGCEVDLTVAGTVPPSDNFQIAGQFTTATSGVKITLEMVSMWREPMLLSIDSYTNSPLQGTLDQTNPAGGIGQVGTFATAARATVSNATLTQAAYGSADCNTHGLNTFPYGKEMPKWAFIGVGRTGRKMSQFRANQLAGLNYLMGYHHVVFGGTTNDVGGATTPVLAASIAEQLADDFEACALHALAHAGKFTWIRTPFPPDIAGGTGATMPTFGFALTDSKLCFYTADALILERLQRIQATHPLGHRVAVLTVGPQSFSDGVHIGTLGSAPALIDAITQYKAVSQIIDARSANAGSGGGSSFGAGLAAGLVLAEAQS